MVDKLQAIRGMHDVLPNDSTTWQWLEKQCRDLVASYNYQEIRTPILESTTLFSRSIGEATDIVEKEMYTFEDRNGDNLSLRPEGTAGCVRAGIEHGLLYNQVQRLWYMGPMYRHERPQKGRYRQFYQLGVEAYGVSHPEMEAELIYLSWRLWQRLGLEKNVKLQLNTLGSYASRAAYRQALVAYLEKHVDQLDPDSQRRLKTNPLRILDSKDPKTREIIEKAPVLHHSLSGEDKKHFARVHRLVERYKIPHEINPYLVRGLDYYCHTVFEWVTDNLGAQGTVCAGGRYDGLVEQLGGKPTSAVGFAAGLDRLVLLLSQQKTRESKADVFVVLVGEPALCDGLLIVEKLRDALPELVIETNLTGGSFKSQFKRADKSGAKYALILGDDEIVNQTLSVKPLREQAEQKTMSFSEVVALLQNAAKSKKAQGEK